MHTNSELFERAKAVMPGGVNSPVRSFRSVGGTPYVVASGSGAMVRDVEGNELIDLVQSYGAVIAGHAHPRIVEAIRAAAAEGTSFGAPTRREVLLAEAVRERVPSCEMLRLVSSGTEATMSAVRLARGATGRDRMVRFAGNYHGHADAFLAEAGSGVADGVRSGGVPGSAGVPVAAVADTAVIAYNSVPTLDRDVACVIVEPVAANMGLVAPRPGFLEGLRAECDRVGAILIFDEVITGFRLAPGGAQERFGVEPDLSTFGKVLGGGLNIGAFGGRADLMGELAPLGPVYQAGTLSGNPLATAAGLAALSLLDDGAYEVLDATAGRLVEGLVSTFRSGGVDADATRVGPLVGIRFGVGDVLDADDALGVDRGMYSAFFHAMLERGVALAPGPMEIAFPGLSHTDDIIDRVVEAADGAVRSMSGSDRP